MSQKIIYHKISCEQENYRAKKQKLKNNIWTWKVLILAILWLMPTRESIWYQVWLVFCNAYFFFKSTMFSQSYYLILVQNYCWGFITRWNWLMYWFFSRPLPKAGRELQTELDRRIMNKGGWPLAKNQPATVTGPWVYTETVYLLWLLRNLCQLCRFFDTFGQFEWMNSDKFSFHWDEL